MSKPFYIDGDACISCGTCAELCPDCFKYEGEMDHAEVIGFSCQEDEVQEAMDSCPAECIHWEEE